jgi:hypothetical protein
MNSMIRSLAAVACAAVMLCSAAVASEEPAALERTPSAPGASVGFSNIADGDVVPPVFTVKFTISGMGIAPAGSQIANTGHHHLLIDVDELPDMNQPLPANDHIRHFGKGQTEAQLELTPGPHTLQLLLADYRHVPHDPPVMSDRITITVSPDAPAAAQDGEGASQ